MTGEPTHTLYHIKLNTRTQIINYCLKGKVSIVLLFQLHSTGYTIVWINNCLKSTSVIYVVTMKLTDKLQYERKPHKPPPNWHLLLSAKINGTQKSMLSMKNTLYLPRYAIRHLLDWIIIKQEKKLNKINPVALATVNLHLTEGITQSIR